MNYGLYLSAGGALSSLHRQDVWANNLANVNTAGFKPDLVHVRARLPERLASETQSSMIKPQLMLEQLGGGTATEPTHISFRQADLSQTKNDLDVALDGPGLFAVSKGMGHGADQVRYTRDGRMTRNAAGELVMAATGYRVLDVNDQPIRLSGSSPVRIEADGALMQNGQRIAQLQIARFADSSALTKEGANIMRASADAKRTNAGGTVRQGYIESSGVDPIIAMNQMINASKAVQANLTMMQYHDHILGQAINTFGRVA